MAHTASATAFATKANLEAALVEFCTNQATAEVTHGAISAWDVSAVTDMEELIYNAPCKWTFNSDLNAWDVSQVTITGVRLGLEGAAPTHRTARAHAPD